MVGRRSSRLVNSSRACAGCGLAPSPPARKIRKPGLDRPVGPRSGHRDHADVVEHRLAAVRRAAAEVDLELAGEALGERVAQEPPVGGLGPRRDVEDLERARAGEVAAGHVADGVAARLAAREAHRCQPTQHLGRVAQLDEVELRVLPGGEVAPAPGVLLGDRREHLELLRVQAAVGDLHPHHLVGAALALSVDALVQAADPEDVLVEVTGEVVVDRLGEAGDLVVDLGVDRPGSQLVEVDGHGCVLRGEGTGSARPPVPGRGGSRQSDARRGQTRRLPAALHSSSCTSWGVRP